MKRLFFLLFCLTSVYCRGYSLDSLDSVLSNRDKYVSIKQSDLARLTDRLNPRLSVGEQLLTLKTLSAEYATFQFDSAMHYTNRLHDLAVSAGKKDYEHYARIARASLLTTSGLFHEAVNCLDNIPRKELDNSLLPDYFKAYEWAYSMWAEYASDSIFSPRYYERERAYQDSILQVLPESTVEHIFWQGEKALRTGDLDLAQDCYMRALDSVKPNERLYAQITFCLSLISETRGDAQERMHYLALAAISDLLCPLKENLALQVIALEIAQGDNPDYERANRYLRLSLEDAQFYGNRLRLLEIAQKMPHIVNGYENQLERANSRQHAVIIVVGILALMLIATLAVLAVFIHRLHNERKLIETARDELKAVNEQKETANHKLHETNVLLREQTSLRESCISLFMELTAAYINKLNMFQLTVQRKVKTHQTDDLLKLATSTRQSEQDTREFFMSFDKTFLNTFPDFVENINMLLKEDERFRLPDSTTLNLYLRILALMRLGVKDTAKIATLLNCSQQTVYNHRSIVKSRAINKDTFDKDLMKV